MFVPICIVPVIFIVGLLFREGTSVGDSVLLDGIHHKVHKKNSCNICQKFGIKLDHVLMKREISTL